MSRPNITQLWMPTGVAANGVSPLTHMARDFFLPSPAANSGIQTSSFAMAGRTTITPGQDPLVHSLFGLAPREKVYLIGLLAETSLGMVLGVSTYMGTGHVGIASEITKTFGRISVLLWGGELLVENRSDLVAPGQIAALNETSGFISQYAQKQNRKLTNSVYHLPKCLGRRSPVAATPDMQLHSFDPDKPHLHPKANVFDSYMRHAICNALAVLEILLAQHNTFVLQHIMDRFRKYAYAIREVITFIELILEEDATYGHQFRPFIRTLEKILIGQNITLQDFLGLRLPLQIIQRNYLSRFHKNVGNTYDLFTLNTPRPWDGTFADRFSYIKRARQFTGSQKPNQTTP